MPPQAQRSNAQRYRDTYYGSVSQRYRQIQLDAREQIENDREYLDYLNTQINSLRQAERQYGHMGDTRDWREITARLRAADDALSSSQRRARVSLRAGSAAEGGLRGIAEDIEKATSSALREIESNPVALAQFKQRIDELRGSDSAVQAAGLLTELAGTGTLASRLAEHGIHVETTAAGIGASGPAGDIERQIAAQAMFTQLQSIVTRLGRGRSTISPAAMRKAAADMAGIDQHDFSQEIVDSYYADARMAATARAEAGQTGGDGNQAAMETMERLFGRERAEDAFNRYRIQQERTAFERERAEIQARPSAEEIMAERTGAMAESVALGGGLIGSLRRQRLNKTRLEGIARAEERYTLERDAVANLTDTDVVLLQGMTSGLRLRQEYGSTRPPERLPGAWDMASSLVNAKNQRAITTNADFLGHAARLARQSLEQGVAEGGAEATEANVKALRDQILALAAYQAAGEAGDLSPTVPDNSEEAMLEGQAEAVEELETSNRIVPLGSVEGGGNFEYAYDTETDEYLGYSSGQDPSTGNRFSLSNPRVHERVGLALQQKAFLATMSEEQLEGHEAYRGRLDTDPLFRGGPIPEARYEEGAEIPVGEHQPTSWLPDVPSRRVSE